MADRLDSIYGKGWLARIPAAAKAQAAPPVAPPALQPKVTAMPTAPATPAFAIPWAQIDATLAKLDDLSGSLAKAGPFAAGLFGAMMPQLKPLLGGLDELQPRIRMIELMSKLEQAAEGLDGDAERNAMADAAEKWAKAIRPPPAPFVDGNIPGTTS